MKFNTSPARTYWLWALGLTVVRLLVLVLSPYDLYVEEPYYWTWSQHLDWGYYSKPPLMAALIATTTTFGSSVLTIKLGAVLLYPVTGWFIYLSASRLMTAGTASHAAVLFQFLPGVAFSSLVMSTDVPLLACWSAAVWLFLRASESVDWRWWAAVGIAAGLGMLSKYNMALLAPGMLLALAWNPAWRHHFRRIGPYLAMTLALLIWLPNLWWNAEHHFPTFTHTFEISGLGTHHWPIQPGLSFVAAQFGIMGPVCFALSLWALLTGRHHPALRTLIGLTLPGALVTLVVAATGEANANWSAPLLINLTLAFALWAETHPRYWRYAWLTNGALVVLLYTLMVSGGLDLAYRSSAHHHPLKRVLGWDNWEQQLSPMLDTAPATCIISPSRDVLAWFTFYHRRSGHIQTWSVPPANGAPKSQYDIDRPLHLGEPSQSCLLVVNGNDARVAQQFAERQQLGSVSRQWHNQSLGEFSVWRVSHWQGPGR